MAKINKLLEHAKVYFDPDEKPIQTILGSYETEIIGQNSVRSGILVATNKRLVFFAKKLIGFELKYFPYNKISSVEWGKNMVGHHVEFIVSGNQVKVKWIYEGDVPNFVEAVQANLEH